MSDSTCDDEEGFVDDIVRIGVLGTGIGRYVHLPAFHHTPGAQVVAVYSTPLAAALETSKHFGVPYVYDNWEQMLDEQKLDLVDIALPPFLHYPVAMAALERGCNVLCEKPLSVTLEEAKQMLLAAETCGVVHIVDHQLRFSPTYNRVKLLIAEGYVGKVYHVRWSGISSFRADSKQPWIWWSDVTAGGGNLLASASHIIDTMRWMLGEVRAVSGQLTTWVKERPIPETGDIRSVTSDDQYSLLLEMKCGTLVWNFFSAVGQHPTGTHFELIGSDGSLIITSDEELWAARAGEPLRKIDITDPNSKLEGVPSDIWGASFVGLACELIAAIREHRAPHAGATFYDGMRTQEILDAARRSWLERRWIEVSSPT